MKLKELKSKKYIALIMMIVIIGAIVGILKIGNMDFDKGKVKVSKAVINNVTSSLSANVNEAIVDNLITSKGYDEIDYVIKYSLSTDENIKERDVMIEASLDDNEKYASFKDITNGDVTSTVSENRKNIKITVKNAKVNKENELKLVMKLEGAPNGYKVTPKIKIKEVSEEKYTNLNVQNVEVKNNSLTGNVQDEQSMNVSNIELALKKDGETIKKTYTDENGNYVFSDIEEGEYDLEIDEDIYEKVSEEKVNISGSSKLNIVVKEVTPYKIELKKRITEMTIVNGGKTTTYKYGNLDKVQQALKNVKNMTGEVKYKITIQNTGKKSGVVTVVKDEMPEGLTFNKEKNTSWEEKNGILYNRSLEGITLNVGEKREEGLTLDIESTSEAKTYINKVTAKGEIYENIVYILDGKTYKEDTVLEGEKIKEPKVDNKNFKGWYTDKKYTNKYNFNNEVKKDLVLYGQTEDIKEYTVTYVDNEKIVKTEKVKENGSLNAPEVSKEGYTFKCWSEEPNGKEYDLSTKVTKDITLYSVYDINKYTVTFINENEKYDEQQIEYGGNIKAPTSPSKTYYIFKYWSLEENGDSYDLNTKVTKDITLYSVYDINKYTVTFIDKGKEIDKQELEAGSIVIAPKVSMEGYTFKYWSEKENGEEYNLNLPITKNLTLYSVYEINKYNVEFYDNDKLIKIIKVDYDNTINSNEVPTVSKTGYTFTGWTENDKNFDFTTKIKENKKLYSKYEIIKNAVIFNDENRITTKNVDYNNKVEKIESQGKTGYTFKYWSLTQDGEEFDFNTLITESITLYAVYNINEYNVNFIDQGNAYGDTQKVKYNNAAVKPETDPTKEGYTFKYWSLEENGAAYDFNTKITKNTTLYSVYSINNYKVSFIDNGTKYIEDETIEYNGVAVKPETDPSKEGYTFRYWSLEENGTVYDFNTKITKDITLYSVYSVNSYKVSFIDNGTKYIEDETIEYNGVAVKPETDPSKVGHTFKYWSLKENGTAYNFNTRITKDTILYSVYDANEYTVKFMDGDNLFKQEQVKYGLKVTKPSENPTKEHNIFKTWTLNDNEYNFDLPVTDNIVLHSTYEEIEKPSISHVPTEWTNNKVTVTITSSHEDYKYLYKIDTGEYKEYTGPFDIDYNCTVVAKSVKENVDSITESHDITNIDKIKPTINSLSSGNITDDGFDININSIDNESGMKRVYIYKDDVLETSIVYNEQFNEEKNSSYTFSGLSNGETYKIKVVAEDVAGNLSESKEIDVEIKNIIVARIIGRKGNLYNNESLYENFNSLKKAIKSCGSNQCTIQMVLDTNESVEVLDGQDITLDINGKIITGTKDIYTINNSGEFTIIDNATTPGSVVNKDGVALKNETSGILTLGELEEELDVSTTKPYINGGTFGIVNEYIDASTKGKFNFYDGMISGNIAIEGEVNDKPYLYNASVVTSDDRQTATLKILEDAEAKIVRTGVYYTKVEQAVSDTNKGTSEEKVTNTLLMQGFKNIGEYGFNYDSETNTLTSTNNHNSKSYTTIDLTGYETDEQLTFNGFKTRNNSTASITIKEDNKNGTLVTPSENADISLDASTITYILSKGKRYYVELGYTVTSLTEEDKFVINSINLQPIKKYEITKNTEFKSLSTTYGFDYDEETRTFKSNNQYISGSTAFSYIEVDLTNSTENKQVIINASLDTLSSSNVGNIVISEDNNKLTSSTRSALAYMYVSGYSSDKNYSGTFVGPEQYTRVLQKGKKYYIQFYYFKSSDDSYTIDDYKNNDSNDQFIINSIDVVSASSALKDYDLQNDLIRDEGINFYSSSNYIYTYDAGHAYLKADLTNETEDKVLRLKLYSSYQNFYVVVSDSTDIPENKNAIIDTSNKTIYDNEYNYGTIPHGKISYIHFVKKGTNYLTLNEVSILNEKNIDLNTELITNNKGFTNYNSQENSYTTPLNIGAKEKYDSYLKIDLTNYKEDQMISINAHLATTSYNLSNIYITSNPKDVSAENLYTNPSNTLLTYNSSKSPGNNDAYYFTTYSYILPKGNVYYVHFSDYNYSLNSSTIYSSNLFQIKSVKLSPLTGSIFSTGKNPYMKGTIAQGDSANDFVTEDETNDKNFRFIGSNTKNYVKFNNEIWRVIGIFSTTNEKGVKANRIKLIRNDSISDNLAWDTSLSSINNGWGINDWSQADVMKLLNNGYEDNEDELETGETIKVNNSLYYNKKSGKCFAKGQNNTTIDCDFSSTGLNDEAKKMIETVVWNTGAIPINTSNLTPLDVYTYERGNLNGKQDFDSSSASFAVDNYQRKTTWTGKVGLPYASDIIMASGDGNSNNRNGCMTSSQYGDCLYNNNWIKNMENALILTMNVNYGGSFPSFITAMTSSITSFPAGYSEGTFRPVVYLDTKVKVESGTGTSADPFILTLGNEDNNTLYYGLVPKLLEKEDDTTINDKEPTNDYTLLKNGDVYGFTYNSESNTFTNENKSLNSSTAISYIKIDLTNEKSDKTIKINYLSTSNYYMASTVVHINLMKDSLRKIDYTISDENSPNSYYKDSIYRKSITEYSNNQPGTIIQKLEKGNIYYLQFAVVKNTSDRYTEEFNFNIEYMDDEDKKENYTRYDGIIPTLNKEADTVQVLKDIILSQSLNIENTRSMILDLNGHTITTTSNDYVINNNGELTITDRQYENASDQKLLSYEKQKKYYNENVDDIKKECSNNENEIYKIEAEDTNIISGKVTNREGYSNGQGLDLGYDFSFNFDVTESSEKKLVIYAGSLNRQVKITLNDKIVYTGTFSSTSTYGNVQISLGNLAEGNYTLKFEKVSGYTPIFDYFEIKNASESSRCDAINNVNVKNNMVYEKTNGSSNLNDDGSFVIDEKNNGVEYYNKKLILSKNGTYSINGTITYKNSVTASSNIYVGISKTKDINIDDFVTYKKIPVISTTAYNNTFSLDITESGEYYFKIVAIKDSSKNYSLTTTLNNLSLSLEPKITYASENAFTKGSIISTVNTVIYNGENAYLDVEKVAINGKKLNGIDNYGQLKIGSNGTVTASSIGILNESTGEILEGLGTISGSKYSLSTSSYKKNDIKGYTFTTKPINNESNAELTLTDVTINNYDGDSAIIDGSISKLTINNSKIYAPKSASSYSDYYTLVPEKDGTVEINNSNIYGNYAISNGLNSGVSSVSNSNRESNKNIIINNSNLDGNVYMNTDKTIDINNSTINKFYLGKGTGNLNTVKLKSNEHITNKEGLLTISNCDYSSLTLDNYKDAIINKNSKISRLVNKGNTITMNDSSIPGYGYIENNGVINLTNIDMESGKIINSYGNINMNNVVMNKTYEMTTSNGELNFDNLTVSAFGLSIDSTKTGITIKNSDLKDTTIVKDYAILTLNNTSMTATSDSNKLTAITNKSGTVNLEDNVNISNYYNGLKSEYGTVNVGINDDTVKDNIVVDSRSAAIYNGSHTTFNYYDGIIKGQFSTKIDNYPENYDINHSTEDNKDITSLIKKEEKDYVAKIGDNKYKTLQEAFDSVQSNNVETEVDLISDIYTLYNSIIDENKNIKLNFNGKFIRSYQNDQNILFTNNGILSIVDSKKDDAAQNTLYGTRFIVNNGVLNYNDAIVYSPYIVSNFIDNNGTINLNSGRIEVNRLFDRFLGVSYAYADVNYPMINSNEDTVINILDGTYYTDTTNIIKTKDEINVRGGTYYTNPNEISYAFDIDENAKANITSGEYNKSIVKNFGTTKINNYIYTKNAGGYNIGYNHNNGSIEITNSKFGLISFAIESYGGNIKITNSEMNATDDKKSMFILNDTNTEIIEGKYVSEANSFNVKNGNLKIKDTSITSANNGINILGEENSEAILNIESGTLESSKTAILANDNTTVNIGIKGDILSDDTLNVSIENPKIKGKNKGISSSSQSSNINFYDGIIIGETPIDTAINEIEDGYAIYDDTKEDLPARYLKPVTVAKNLTTNKEYEKLNDAIEEANNNDVIQIIHSITTLSSSKTNVIPIDKKITIDLNGFNIIQSNDVLFENNGNLILTDNTYNNETSNNYIYNKGGKLLVQNNGTLSIENINIKDNTKDKVISNNKDSILNINNAKITKEGKGIIIENNGTLSVKKSNITASIVSSLESSEEIAIKNNNDAVIDNSVISYTGNNYALNNTGVLTISNSNITGEINNSGTYNSTSDTVISSSIVNTSTMKFEKANITGNNNNAINTSKGNSLLQIKDSVINSKFTATSYDSVINVNGGELKLIDTNITVDVTYSLALDKINMIYANSHESTPVNIDITGGEMNIEDGRFIRLDDASSSLNMNGTTINALYGVISSDNAQNKLNLINLNMNGIVDITGKNSNVEIDVTGGNYEKAIDLSEGNVLNLKNATVNGIIYNTKATVNAIGSTLKQINSKHEFEDYENYGTSVIETTTIDSVVGNNVTIKSGTIVNELIGSNNLVIGETGDSNVSITDPVINGNIHLPETGTFKFYDGIIKGDMPNPTIVEEGYNLKITDDGKYLVNTNVIKNITQDKEYSNIASAISELNNNDELQLLEDNVLLYTNIGGTIDYNKTITLDLNGKYVYTPKNSTLFENVGSLNVKDNISTDDLNRIVRIANSGTVNLLGGNLFADNSKTINVDGGLLSGENNTKGTINVSGGTINNLINYGTVIQNSGVIQNFENHNSLTVNNGTLTGMLKNEFINNINITNAVFNNLQIYNRGKININNITKNTNSTSSITNYRELTITGGNYTGNISNNENGILTFGELDGNVSTSNPIINGTVSNDGTFNYYDGKIISDIPFKGTITNTEPGYRLSINDDTENNTKYAILIPISDDERVAVVNGINYADLQTAINSVKDNVESNVVIYKDIELTEDITIPANKIINLYLNNHVITYNGYEFVKNGTLTIIDSAPSESIGASIINTIGKILNINQNRKNIIVYEMSDGSKLSTENTYNLYKKVDNEYKLLNMEKDEEVGRYITGSNNSEMTSIKGRIYLNNLEEGSYKLVSSDNKDIEFTIAEDGKANGNILENTSENRKVIETALAYLIITIQTGVNQIKYIIYIVLIVSIILGLCLAFKEQRKLSRKM